MFLAIFDSGSFTFHAAGTTREEALGVLGTAWEIHANATGAAWTVEQVAEDANVVEIAPGVALRDWSPIARADTWSSASRQTFIDTGAYLPAGWDGDEDGDPDREPHPFDMPSPVADLLSRFRTAHAEVRAMYAALETEDAHARSYDEADEAADDLADIFLVPLADALGDVIGEQR